MTARAAALLVAAGLLVAGCGSGGDSSDVPPAVTSATPAIAIAQAAEPGGEVRPGPRTPGAVAKALESRKSVVVVAILLKGVADDDSVARAIASVRRTPVGKNGVKFFVYRFSRTAGFGDLPEVLGIDATPGVAVIAKDGTLVDRWIGLVDAGILQQSVSDARDR